jgi:hypothetical protein
MSVSDLFSPNTYDLFCNALTANSITANVLNVGTVIINLLVANTLQSTTIVNSGAITTATLNATTSLAAPVGNLTTLNSTTINNSGTINTTNLAVSGTFSPANITTGTITSTTINNSGAITCDTLDAATSVTTLTVNSSVINNSNSITTPLLDVTNTGDIATLNSGTINNSGSIFTTAIGATTVIATNVRTADVEFTGSSSTITDIESNTFVPFLANVSNMATLGLINFSYTVINSNVFCSFNIEYTPTAVANSSCAMSIPIPRSVSGNFTATSYAMGSASQNDLTSSSIFCAAIYFSAGTQDVMIIAQPVSAPGDTVNIGGSFMYVI